MKAMQATQSIVVALCLGAASWSAQGVGQEMAAKQPEKQADLQPETIRWPIPWKAGQALSYETENLEEKTEKGKPLKLRTISSTTITITQASTQGYVQRWTGGTPRVEVLQGDPASAAMMSELYKSLADLAIVVELDKDANYKRIGNIDEISTRMRAALEPALMAGVQDTAPGNPAPDGAAMRTRVAQVLDTVTEPRVLENMLGKLVQNYNAFVGIELEDGARYAVDSELENPMGGAALPAKIEFGLYASEDDPNDVFLEWTTNIDPERRAKAAWDIMEKLAGVPIPEAERKKLPDRMEISDEGFVLFNRRSGVIEMYEYQRNVQVKDLRKTERDRMRLVDGDHTHTWKEDAAAEEDDA